VSQVESCFADSQDYRQCTTAAELGTTGLDLGTSDGQVNVTSGAADGYVVTAYSKSSNTFTITKTAGGPVSRTCTGTTGGCKNNSW
jgi:hypothetical protein